MDISCPSCENKVSKKYSYCPRCGDKIDSTESQDQKYDMNDVDTPIVFSYQIYKDKHELWKAFTREVFGKKLREEDIENISSKVYEKMGYCIFTVYFVFTGRKIKGPFLEKSQAESIADDHK